MIKLSELGSDVKIMDYNLSVHDAIDIQCDIKHYLGENWYIAVPYHATFNAEDVLETIIENECDNMYEDWDESIWQDITSEDMQKLQNLLDDILLRDEEGNIAYYQGDMIDLSK